MWKRTSGLSCREQALVDLFDQDWIDSGLSQSEIARRAGVSTQVVNSFVMGYSIPRVDHLLRIADALGTPLWRYLKLVEERTS